MLKGENDKGLPINRGDMRRSIFRGKQLGMSEEKIADALAISISELKAIEKEIPYSQLDFEIQNIQLRKSEEVSEDNTKD
jgi:hypothetical protein